MFDELSLFMRKPEFWFATVLVSAALSLAMAYVKELLDRHLIAPWSAERRERLNQEHKEHQRRVRRLVSNPAALDVARHAEIQMRLSAVVVFVLTCLAATIGGWLTGRQRPWLELGMLVLVLIGLLASIMAWSLANEMGRDVRRAGRELIRKLDDEPEQRPGQDAEQPS